MRVIYGRQNNTAVVIWFSIQYSYMKVLLLKFTFAPCCFVKQTRNNFVAGSTGIEHFYTIKLRLCVTQFCKFFVIQYVVVFIITSSR